MAALFDRLDANHDGLITRAEWAAAVTPTASFNIQGAPHGLTSLGASIMTTPPGAHFSGPPSPAGQVHFAGMVSQPQMQWHVGGAVQRAPNLSAATVAAPVPVPVSPVGAARFLNAAVPSEPLEVPPMHTAAMTYTTPGAHYVASSAPAIQYSAAPAMPMTAVAQHLVAQPAPQVYSPAPVHVAPPVLVRGDPWAHATAPAVVHEASAISHYAAPRYEGYATEHVSFAPRSVPVRHAEHYTPASQTLASSRAPLALRGPPAPRLDALGPNERVIGERPISREELFSTGNLLEGPSQEVPRGGRYGAAPAWPSDGAAPSVVRYQSARTYAPPLAGSAALFNTLDRNHDGVLSREEYLQGLSGEPVAIF